MTAGLGASGIAFRPHACAGEAEGGALVGPLRPGGVEAEEGGPGPNRQLWNHGKPSSRVAMRLQTRTL